MGKADSLVVVGVDGSQKSQAALRWAIVEAQLWGAALEVVVAWHLPAAAVADYGPAMVPVFYPGYLAQRATQIAQGATAEVRAAAPNLPTQVSVVEAHPAEALLRASLRAELLVVGSRGLGGFAGTLVGSTALHCVHHARCPVVVVPSRP